MMSADFAIDEHTFLVSAIAIPVGVQVSGAGLE